MLYGLIPRPNAFNTFTTTRSLGETMKVRTDRPILRPKSILESAPTSSVKTPASARRPPPRSLSLGRVAAKSTIQDANEAIQMMMTAYPALKPVE